MNIDLALWVTALKYARAAADMSQEALGEAIGYSASLVASIETHRRVPTAEFAQRADDALNANGLLVALHEEAAGKGKHRPRKPPAWAKAWQELEAEATEFRWFEALVIPGLLQTEAYARDVLGCNPLQPDEVEHRLALRLSRRAILDRDNPPALVVVLDECVLRRGNREVMREQLEHLAEMATRPKVFIHIVPADTPAYLGWAGPFIIASFDGGDDVGYLDDQLQGRIIPDAAQVSKLRSAWDTVRAEALSRGQSRDLIVEASKSWP